MDSFDYMQRAYQQQLYADVRDEYRRIVATMQLTSAEHLLGSRAMRRLADLRGARGAVEAALKLQPTGNLLGECRFQAGILYREMGDVSLAVTMFEVFLDGLDDYPQLRGVAEGAARHNLGLALRQQRRFGEAIEAYWRALECHRRDGMDRYRCTTLHSLAWSLCLHGSPGEAEGCLVEAEPLCQSDEERGRQAIGRGHLALCQGHLAMAVHYVSPVIEQAGDYPAAVVSHAYWIVGHMALLRYDLSEAESMALLAVKWAQRDSDGRTFTDASELLAAVRRQMSITAEGGM